MNQGFSNNALLPLLALQHPCRAQWPGKTQRLSSQPQKQSSHCAALQQLQSVISMETPGTCVGWRSSIPWRLRGVHNTWNLVLRPTLQSHLLASAGRTRCVGSARRWSTQSHPPKRTALWSSPTETTPTGLNCICKQSSAKQFERNFIKSCLDVGSHLTLSFQLSTGWRRREAETNSEIQGGNEQQGEQYFDEVLGAAHLEGTVFTTMRTLMALQRSHKDRTWEHQADSGRKEGTTRRSSLRKKRTATR